MPSIPFLKKGTLTHVNELKTIDYSISADGKPTPLITGKDATFGMHPVIKTLYEGKNSQRGGGGNFFDWVDSPPKQLSQKTIRTHDRVAIKVFKIKDHDQPTIGGRTPLKIHQIDVQSPYLIAALKDIVERVGIFLEVHEVAHFQSPFRPLYFCYGEIKALHRRVQSSDPILAAHVRLLLSVLAELFDGFQTQLEHLRSSKLINFKLAWTYFPRGCPLYCAADGTERLIRVEDTNYVHVGKNPGLYIVGDELAFDGEKFKWQPTIALLPRFEGNQPIIDMPVLPIAFHPEADTVRSRLSERGRRVIEYQELALRECEGVGVHDQDGIERKHTISGRILVDFYGYQKHHRGLERTDVKEGGKDEMTNPAAPPPVEHEYMPIVRDHLVPPEEPPKDKKGEVYVQRLSKAKQIANKEDMLKRPGDLPFLSPTLYGYSLKGKMWVSFHVNDLRPVQWNDEAYDHLVYPEEQKDLVLSFVRNHRSTAKAAAEDGVDDVILGKGRGLVILLSGPPGTGKTLTAEAVADQTRRPLFCIQAEDLGTSAAMLGAQLKKFFTMAIDWNAVVLLDEADVFMAVRQPSDVVRNELVSIFLRELEYFTGTIFLTTNLLQNIDHAFRSRVDIHLLFNPLPAAARQLLWRKFLRRLPAAKPTVAIDTAAKRKQRAAPEGDDGAAEASVQLSDEAYDSLGRWDLNGREIKNAVKTVRTWCLCKGYNMDLARLEAGIRVTAPMARKLDVGERSGDGKNGRGDWVGAGGWGNEA